MEGIADELWKLKPTCNEEDQTEKVDRKKDPVNAFQMFPP